MSNKYKALIIILIIVLTGLVVRVVFDSKFDDFQNLVQWEKDYKEAHPNATKEEVDKALKDGFKGLEDWTNQYKIDHPGATDEEINKAFKDAWGNKKRVLKVSQ